MPTRYQPPMIVGGNRNNPVWSELLSYYLPQQQGYSSRPTPPGPNAPGGNSYGTLAMLSQRYSDRPIQRDYGRDTKPSPWQGGGGSSFDEIMARLGSGRPGATSAPMLGTSGNAPAPNGSLGHGGPLQTGGLSVTTSPLAEGRGGDGSLGPGVWSPISNEQRDNMAFANWLADTQGAVRTGPSTLQEAIGSWGSGSNSGGGSSGGSSGTRSSWRDWLEKLLWPF